VRLPNGYGGVTKLSGRRRKPYMVRKTIGWHIDEKTDKKVQDYVVIGYAATKSEALQMLADYNNNPFDVSASKITFKEALVCGEVSDGIGFQRKRLQGFI